MSVSTGLAGTVDPGDVPMGAPLDGTLVDGARLATWRAFLAAHATVRAALEEELERERGIALTVYDVLVQLSSAPGGRLRMQELANRLVFSRSGVTRLVDRMARDGLAAREPCRDDRRGTFAVITDLGRETLRDASGVHLRGIATHFGAALDDADVSAVGRAMERILAANRPPDDFEKGSP